MQDIKLSEHLEKLTYFRAIVENGSIYKASRSLRISQPALSKSLSALEGACGTTLLERRRSGVRLTDAGQRVFQLSGDISMAVNHCVQDLAQDKTPTSLRLATHEVILAFLFPRLTDLLADHNGLQLSIHTNPSVRHLVEKIIAGESDVGVIASPPSDGQLHVEEFFSDSYGFFASPSFLQSLKLQSKFFTADDIKTWPLILAPGLLAGTNGKTILDCLQEESVSYSVRHQVTTIESAMSLAAAGAGISLIPKKTGAVPAGSKLVEVPVDFTQAEKPFGGHGHYFCCRKQSWEGSRFYRDIFDLLKNAVDGVKG